MTRRQAACGGIRLAAASSGGHVVHESHNAREHVGVGLRRNTVPEVHHMRRGGAAAGEHIEDMLFQHRPRRAEQRGMKGWAARFRARQMAKEAGQ